jgi:hypothetical protein
MTGQRRPVPLEQPDRLALADARSQAPQQAEHAIRGLAGGPFEGGQLLDLVDHAQAVAGVDQQVRGVLHETGRSDTVAQRVDQECRCLDRRALRVGLPADDADPGPWAEPLARQDLGERPRAIAWLPGQAQVLEALPPHRQRRGARQAVTLVADQDRRIVVRSDEEHGFLEAWVEAAQVGEVGAVLAVGVDDDPVVAARVHPLAQALQPGGVVAVGDPRLHGRHPEIGQVDVREARRWSDGTGPSIAGRHGAQASTRSLPRVTMAY